MIRVLFALALAFAGLVAGQAEAATAAVPSDVAALLAREDALNEACRGGSGDDPRTAKACAERDQAVTEVELRGWCWGPDDRPEYQKVWFQCAEPLKNPVRVAAQALSAVPGALVCKDYRAATLVFDLYAYSWEEKTQDRLTNGQSQLVRGEASQKPDPAIYGCALVEPGSFMLMEQGNAVPVVSAKLPDGSIIRGVTLPAMVRRL